MLDLILDTSTDLCFILICQEKTILASRFFPSRHNLSSALVPTIQELLASQSQKIGRIFVGVGPGSYTGLRVAVCVANALSLSMQIPLYPFCSLLAFIPPSLPSGSFGYLVPSVHSALFLLQGSLEEKILSSHTTQRLLEKQDLISLLPTIPSLVSLETEKTQKKLLPYVHSSAIFQGEFNAPFLLSYLPSLKASPSTPPNILYLHAL